MKVKLEALGVESEAGLICPSGLAGHEIALEELFELVKGTESEEKVAQMSLRQSLRRLEGMVFCPREHCDYVGWVRTNEKCTYPLVCELCGSNWRDDDLLPTWKRVTLLASRLFSCQEDSLSVLWKDLWTEACPGCGTLIEKNGGCPHMNCFRCKLDFCWTCMRPYRNHDSDLCAIRMAVYTAVYTLFCLLMVLKLLWICNMVTAFFNTLLAFFMTAGLLGLGAAAVGITAECRCGFCALILYIGVHIATILYSELGSMVLKIEAGAGIIGLHCLVGFAYLKYNS